MSVHVLDDHDGVIDEDADREDQGEQGNPIDRKAPSPGGEERGGQCDNDGGAHHRGFPLTHGQQHQDHDRRRGKQELLYQFLCFVIRRDAVVACNRHLDPGRDRDAFQLFDSIDDRGCDIDRVAPEFLP
jgi:hypothetical protein